MITNPHNHRLYTRRARLWLAAWALLLLVAPTTAQGQQEPLRGSLEPMPASIGHGLVTWHVDKDVRQWWLYHCGPQDGACALVQTGITPGHGTIEVFSPRPNEQWRLSGWVGAGEGVYTVVEIGTIPSDWARRWAVLPVVIR